MHGTRALFVCTAAFVGLVALGCGSRARGTNAAGPSPRTVVPLASLAPTGLAVALSGNQVCPGKAVQVGVLVSLADREIAAVEPLASESAFAEIYRPRIAAALAPNDRVDLADLDVQVEGPGTFRGHVIHAESDVAAALRGPIRLTVRSRHHPSLEPVTVAIPVTFACEYSFGGRGADGASGENGADGAGGDAESSGEPGGPGGPGQPGGPGPAVEVRAVPVAAPNGEVWIAVGAAAESELATYLIAPGGRVTVYAQGGDGGAGGAGGAGGPGYDQNFDYETATDGGPGGAGGPGGPGGQGGAIRFLVDPSISNRLEAFASWDAGGGRGGAGGAGGPGGTAGYTPIEGANREAFDGPEGPAGPDGTDGPAGEATADDARMSPPFVVDPAALAATIAAAADTPDRHFDATPRTAGGQRAPAAATSAEGTSAASTTAETADARPTPAGGGASQPAGGTAASTPDPENESRRRLATGRFVLANIRLVDGSGNEVATVDRQGNFAYRGRAIARIEGGAVLRDGRIVIAIERNGTLHIDGGDGLQPMGRIAPDGTVSGNDGTEIRIAPNGRITSVSGGAARELESRFVGLPANARRTAAVVVLMASTGLR